ncbi:retrovirus-related pol polyprotein from transposon tnt 1-94 [Lasius niger]|uniref:Retrovirus-related pol polyprotein from transposon tnt 1-94 n=1 Tax=Lasius niger TaxID=67767 RepID=A0A0J7KBF8_LASNI|nr:retrovirus-related pol polyprotein from transposon tnt 1-94 [Lasius niger]
MYGKRQFGKKQNVKNQKDQDCKKDKKAQNAAKNETFKFKCHRCRKVGHKASECTERIKETDKANIADNLSLCASTNLSYIMKAEGKDTYANTTRGMWCVDSGCTAHMCGNDDLQNFDKSTVDKVNLASKSSIDIRGKGSISLTSDLDGKIKNININDALHVPELRTNLLSVGKLCDKGFKVVFEADGAQWVET